MASGILQVKYGSEQIASKVRRASSELNGISGDLNSIHRTISRLPERSSSGNLSKACAFLRKKQQDVVRRGDALETLKERSADFMSHVETAEKRLSKNIERSYKEFHKATGIGQGALAYALEKLFDAAKGAVKTIIAFTVTQIVNRIAFTLTMGQKIWEGIKNWYNTSGKYIVDFALSVVGLVATLGAIAAFSLTGPVGVIAAVALGIKLASDIVEVAKSGTALIMYCSGNPEMANELRSMSAGEMLYGRDSFAAKVYDGVTFTAEIVTLAIDIGSLAKHGFKAASSTAKNASKLDRFKAFGKGVSGKIADNFRQGLSDLKNYGSFIKKNGFLKGSKLILNSNFGRPSAGMDAFKGFAKSASYLSNFKTFIELLVSKDKFKPAIGVTGFVVGG